MKTRTLTAAYGLLLLTLLLGIAVIIVTTVEPVTVNVTPFFISLEDPPEGEFKLRITDIPAPYKPSEINATTVRICTILPIIIRPPSSPKYLKWRFEAQLHGPSLVTVIRSKAGHLIPGVKTPVELAVTGQFNDGTQFQGTLVVTIRITASDPPPP